MNTFYAWRIRCHVGASSALAFAFGFVVLNWAQGSSGADTPAASRFQEEIQPILIDHCYGCHADGTKKGGVAFDGFDSEGSMRAKRELWSAVLKNVRAGIMPPAEKPRPSDKELQLLTDWIKRDVLGADAKDPDPGRVTIRRLNRVEYGNTIRDLLGFDLKVEEEFPPDDTGYGFDTIGDVLTVSPLLLEKYMRTAESIVAGAVPTASHLIPERAYPLVQFDAPVGTFDEDRLNFYKPAKVSRRVKTEIAGDYRIALELTVQGAHDYDPGRCAITLKLDNQQLVRETFTWQSEQAYCYAHEETLAAGDHKLTFELEPLNPIEKKVTAIDMRLITVRVQGPLDPKYWTRDPKYDRFWPKSEAPQSAPERRQYAREVLRRFATRAFRRPVEDRALDRLVAIAEGIYQQPGRRFEQGVMRAMVAILASPRFVFRIEATEPGSGGSCSSHPLLDEYSLASRLSYFLWSTMPDDELMRLAGRHELRNDLARQVKRMQEDGRAEALTRNFVGQWLQIRDIEIMNINAPAVLTREGNPGGIVLDDHLRRAMKRETEMAFAHVAREDRSVLELIDCDYTFVNWKLAQVYGIPGVSGYEMRKVTLPKDSPRGGVLAHAAVLIVTSNPDRTSPVKRGQFILDNILGTPTPPPPPDIPALEELKKDVKGRDPTVRELMALHRSKPLCNSCHARMDPLGLALENFNALGLWREKEGGQSIDASGRLITGESFHDIRDLKRALKERHRLDFYRCLTEKLLTYALGRGLEPSDVETVDQIVERLDREGGRFSALLMGVIESSPFQKRRNMDFGVGNKH